MRIPMNYIEQLPIIVFLSMISGLYFALGTLIVVWVMLLGRIQYSYGYSAEQKKRAPGAILGFLGLFALIGMSFASAVALVIGF